MQVFKAFFKTVKRQLSSLLIYFFIFLALTILLTNNGKAQQETTFKAAKINIAVIDRDHTTLSKSLYDYIDAKQKMVTIKDDKETMSDELFYRNVEYILIINQGFEENIKEGNCENIVQNIKVPQSISGQFVDNQVDQYLSTLSTYVSSGYTVDQAATSAQKTAALTTDVSLHTANKQQRITVQPITFLLTFLMY
jgi:ABC-2 type transport system permease protein